MTSKFVPLLAVKKEIKRFSEGIETMKFEIDGKNIPEMYFSGCYEVAEFFNNQFEKRTKELLSRIEKLGEKS